ncbi:hypothetical protein DUNSADRAFT_2361 [Dunaliella salina]|uniref:DNA-directed DNA polymerase family A palm domain-containing protein n=1 Tax=Dunaliella salina TaxID=3046 RepID=A0ABQ7FWI8_DUNSA|nr:hypothetical protein DUNSADRAFT_2361 [Dunaliella salina]|eukprot:KAF5826691.1 hypothetical protein DUNSADRAFT_2361 [Dunaliella salina]
MRQMEVLRQAVLACKLYDVVKVQLHSYGLVPALRDIEMPLVHVLARMESVGMGLDLHSLLVQRLPLRRWLAKLEARAYKHAGMQIVLTSAQQVSQLLYKQLKIPVPTIATKYKSGDYSVNKDDLEEIRDAHPVVPIIQEHRRISKQLSLLQGLVDQVCQVDAHARATAEACAAMLAVIHVDPVCQMDAHARATAKACAAMLAGQSCSWLAHVCGLVGYVCAYRQMPELVGLARYAACAVRLKTGCGWLSTLCV